MKSSSNGSDSDGPAILLLQKWNSAEYKKLDFSQYRQGFISPRRELLLLLSYQSQALLLPLRSGVCMASNDEVDKGENSSLMDSYRVADDMSCTTTSGPVTANVAENDRFSHSNVTRRDDSFHFVSDVNSLAWGVCGDDYDQHDNAPFREFLFVSGNRGVTVHVFMYPDKSSQMNEPIHDGQFEGVWVEWGPSATLARDSKPIHDRSIDVFDVDRMDHDKENLHELCGHGGDDELIRDSTSKRWLKTFLTKVETMENDGNICTRFPDKQSFPSSATTVSFSIFDNNSQLSSLVSPHSSVSSNEDVSDPLGGVSPLSNLSSSNLQSTPDALSNFLEAGMDNSCKCSKVFSSSSHHFIGFILTLVGLNAAYNSDLSERNLNKFIVVVARLDRWGIQWLCTVKLEGSLDMNFEFGWTDFQFMGDLLLCLRASGSIFIYCAMTGKYVTHLDVRQICELYPAPTFQEAEKLHSKDEIDHKGPNVNVKGIDKSNARSNHETKYFGKITFKRLIVGSSSSLINTVDEHGVVYALSAVKHIPRKHYSDSKLFLHEPSGHGMVGWEVGGFDIGQQRLCSNLPGSYYSIFSFMRKKSFPSDAYNQRQKMIRNHQGKGTRYDLCLGGFSAPFETDLPSHFVRQVFLPTHGFSDGDLVCCSPLGITRLVKKKTVMGPRRFKIVHSRLHVNFTIHDDKCSKSCYDLFDHLGTEESSVEEAVGCVFQEHFYLVTQGGLSVVLPSVSVSSNFYPIESIGYRQSRAGSYTKHQGGDIFDMKERKQTWSPWKAEVLDRVLLYETPGEADRVCTENGWDLKVSRMRRLQLALDYLKFDEIEQSLEILVAVDLGEEAILRLLLATAYLMLPKVGNEGEISAASRLLPLASCFATRMIRNYGLAQHKKDAFTLQGMKGSQVSLYPVSAENGNNETSTSPKLRQMTEFLVIIRNLQSQLGIKFRRPGPELGEGAKALIVMDSSAPQDDHELRSADAMSLEANQEILSLRASSLGFNITLKDDIASIALMDKGELHRDFNEVSSLVPQGEFLERKFRPSENPKDMIRRWEVDNMDVKTIVRDALLSDRLPLAVLQLHLHRLKDVATNKEPQDTFTEVHNVGRAIAYDLFLKGETELAVATLRRLGEDIEVCLKQLVFGTVRKSLRLKIANEMTRYGYLGPHEWNLLERISLIERLYPSSSFWREFIARQKELTEIPSTVNKPQDLNLCISNVQLRGNIRIECGEVDGAVLGLWIDMKVNSDFPVGDNESNGGYWVAATVWSDAWDERTFDRIELDQPSVSGPDLGWDSQLEYYICHNNWEEVAKLLNMMPASVMSDGRLQINLDDFESASSTRTGRESPDYGNYTRSVQELDPVIMDIPIIKVVKISRNSASLWLQTLLEQELAKKFIFLKEYWDGTEDIMPLLARSGFITGRYRNSFADETIGMLGFQNSSCNAGEIEDDTMCALHKLVSHYCAQYNLPNLLELYIDNKVSIRDNDSLLPLMEAAGDCQWAKWLLSSRVKGREYDASFWNSRSIMSNNSVHTNNHSVLEINEIILTVDDIAEGGGEMAALATLMHAPILIQNCLSSGSVNRHQNYSAQCTLENLRPILQKFPTLRRTLVASCFGQDTSSNFLGPKVKHVIGNSALSDYLNWRDNIFFSSGRDTSLLQMLPCWFPKAIRRLVQLYVQGPLGWQSLAGLPIEESYLNHDIGFVIKANEHTEVSAVSWEAAIQKRVEEELYDSSLKGTGPGIEHHLHRGRPMAAFTHILNIRAQKMKSEYGSKGESTASASGQTNVQSDVQGLLAPLSKNEVSLISSVIPLAIMHYEDSMLVASCAFLLELCGLSASMLRVDIAALRRIHAFYKSAEAQLSSTASAFHVASSEGDIANSLAQALADDYLHSDGANTTVQKGSSNSVTGKQPSRALMLVLQHLEKASLPLKVEEKTCGSWLSSGSGDGIELRSQQKETSHHWNLLTTFCQMHNIPLSTKYLAVLARDNDWVGFLSEAQIGGYPFDAVIQTASKEFRDLRLKTHILTVLKGMQSKKKTTSSSNSEAPDKQNQPSFSDQNLLIPVELFGILAECESKKNPGESLLIKAKEMCWSVLALIASCFSDVSSLSCLTVWLEITAARETSSIKVNDISSQITKNVGAAVEATNLLPSRSRASTFHYNWRNPKRRRLMEPIPVEPLTSLSSDASSTSAGGVMLSVKGIVSEEEIGKLAGDPNKDSSDSDEGPASLSKMVAVLCEQHLFLPLLRAFEMFLPSCCLLPFIRALQAYSQMRLSEASAHLGSFSSRIKEEPVHLHTGKESHIGISWISSTAVKAADAMLSTCPSPYEKRCLLQLLAVTDFGDGGTAATHYRRLYWKIDLAEPALRKDNGLNLGSETLDDASLLAALEKNGHWAQARNWARQLETSGGQWKSAAHHVTETQAESMVAEWKEFLWDVPEERVALWGHCQMLFLRYSFPALQAGMFFLKHAEAVEKDIPARELHDLLLLSLQWLSGMITQSNPVYPLHLLREIETRVWLLAVESEAQLKNEGDFSLIGSRRDLVGGNTSSIIDRTATEITKMDSHINAMTNRTVEKNDFRESNQTHHHKYTQVVENSVPTSVVGNTKTKRRAKGYLPSKRFLMDSVEKSTEPDDNYTPSHLRNDLQPLDENFKIELSFSKWEERVGPAELERAVLSLLEFGQITAAKQLQNKLSPNNVPSEFKLVDVALKLAGLSTSYSEVSVSMLDEETKSVMRSYDMLADQYLVSPLQVLEKFAANFIEGSGRGLCRRIVAVLKAAKLLGLSFSEAFAKQPIELLQLLSLKAQESFEEAKLIIQTHSMPAVGIAQILADSFLKGLLAAHRGGYMDSQKEEGPAPLLWRFSDFMKWAELCPCESEIGHALMRLVITGQEIPHACEVELLILSHHFYKSSACLDGVDVLVALAATRVEAYVSEGDFPCLARLITGVGNFYALNFILGILIENGQLNLLLQKYSAAAETNFGTAETVKGFRMAVLTSLKHFNSKDLDAFSKVYNHFDMKHETASLLESRARLSSQRWSARCDNDQNEDLLQSMRFYVEAAEVYSSIDAGNKTRSACAQASLMSLQIRMPDFHWIDLSETNARRTLVEQSCFQEALIIAEAYSLNQPSEWALVLWNQMLKPELTEEFVAEFVAVLPLQPSMLADLSKFYRAELAARGDQSQFSVWLTGGGLPADWAKYLGRSFRCLLKRTRDLRLRVQLATVATGFSDVIDACSKALDKVPDNAGPLVLRKGHGGGYLPLM